MMMVDDNYTLKNNEVFNQFLDLLLDPDDVALFDELLLVDLTAELLELLLLELDLTVEL